MAKEDQRVREYMNRLTEQLHDLPYAQVQEIITDIDSHINEGIEGERSVQDILARLGEPEEVAQEFRERLATSQPASSDVERQAVNPGAIASLVLGVLGLFIPIVGIILGAAAIIIGRHSLKEIKRAGGPGSGLGVAGAVLGIVVVLFHGLMILGLVSFSYQTTETTEELGVYQDVIETSTVSSLDVVGIGQDLNLWRGDWHET